ncbi:cardiolipin synthase ClsB [Desulforhopalus vacuolatus]|uniref:cardiolipin synthase ClsB n=1 Tax=Desulforhopalus vacuolatus TaxID=40414 RepID=UPI00196640B7|nr:cardiolipin synthase ClsB [Desulforhopalus vacuolatus]MBM9519534.1 cardiolipin synthase ClsB [Desulforhopalus vacuolatus]
MYSNNKITLLHNGKEYFPALETAFDRATQEIYLESYIFENDHTGRRIAAALRRAALRGVKACLLIDGFGSQDLPKTMIEYLEDGGVLVLKFRPKISPWTLKRQRLRRLHRKLAVIDRNLAFVGGMNIIDDRTGLDSPQYDYAVRVEGPLVKVIHASAHRLWSRIVWLRRLGLVSPQVKERPSAVPQAAGNMRCSFLIRDNFHHRRDIENAYLKAIGLAKREIILANAYFLPGLNFRHALVAAARRGVRVVLLLQGKTDHRLVYYASRALFGTLLDAGIEIYEYHQSILHAKVAVIDTSWATVGSSNLDPFSLLLALEANVVVDDPAFSATLKASLSEAITMGARRISEETWRSQHILLRLVSWLSYGLTRFMVSIAGYLPQGWPKKHINTKS